MGYEAYDDKELSEGVPFNERQWRVLKALNQVPVLLVKMDGFGPAKAGVVLPNKRWLYLPYAPIPSASGFGMGFGYLNTFQQGIWSTRAFEGCFC